MGVRDERGKLASFRISTSVIWVERISRISRWFNLLCETLWICYLVKKKRKSDLSRWQFFFLSRTDTLSLQRGKEIPSLVS